jgi:hypothetical protein
MPEPVALTETKRPGLSQAFPVLPVEVTRMLFSFAGKQNHQTQDDKWRQDKR